MSETIEKIGIPKTLKAKTAFLENKLQNIEDEQGIFGKMWNGTKELTGIGTSQKECETMLKKFEKGDITFEEAVEYLNGFEQKQENMTELAKNIATGVGAIAFATVTAGTGLGLVAAAQAGAPIGAAIKTTLGLADRITNNVDNDAFDTKEIVKDAVSGAVTGTTSAVSSGIMKGINNSSLQTTLLNGAKCGAMCGAIAGSTSYLTDTALEENKKFNFGELTKATATSSLVSSVVGAGVGAGMFGSAELSGNVGKVVDKTTSQVIMQDSTTSSLRKILGRGVKDAAAAVA